MAARQQRRIASWNVNGIRAASKTSFVPWLSAAACDVVLLQEVRADEAQIPEAVREFPGYHQYWFAATAKKGYSGTGILSRTPALRVESGMGHTVADTEGRVLTCEFEDLIAVSAYFPNSQDKGARLDVKLDFCASMEKWLQKLQKRSKPLVLGGDFNVAPHDIDLARPNDNHQSPGFLPEERAWMKGFLAGGYVDTWRSLHPEQVQYSWWSARTGARARNIGWRIDFHVVPQRDQQRILAADIADDVLGSDHCPVMLTLETD
jgi:exodeoxyribonuclease III